jgi:hypothetical protein
VAAAGADFAGAEPTGADEAGEAGAGCAVAATALAAAAGFTANGSTGDAGNTSAAAKPNGSQSSAPGLPKGLGGTGGTGADAAATVGDVAEGGGPSSGVCVWGSVLGSAKGEPFSVPLCCLALCRVLSVGIWIFAWQNGQIPFLPA